SSFRPIPWDSYQCNSARLTLPLGSLINATLFNLRHRPVPYALRRRGSSRIALPTAIASTSVCLSEDFEVHHNECEKRATGMQEKGRYGEQDLRASSDRLERSANSVSFAEQNGDVP